MGPTTARWFACGRASRHALSMRPRHHRLLSAGLLLAGLLAACTASAPTTSETPEPSATTASPAPTATEVAADAAADTTDTVAVAEREHVWAAQQARLAAAAEREAAIRAGAPSELESLELFDVYEGEGVEGGRRSLAWSFRFRSARRTLTDEEVEEAMEAIVTTLEREFDARIRAG